jgi:hypothetical protein
MHGHRRIEARSLGALSERAANEGRFEDARDLLVQSFRIDRELGNVPFVSMDLVRFAVIHTREARPETAARLIARAVTVFQEIGLTLESWMAQEVDDATAAVRARLDDDVFAAAWQKGEKLTIDEAVALALDDAEAVAAPKPGEAGRDA